MVDRAIVAIRHDNEGRGSGEAAAREGGANPGSKDKDSPDAAVVGGAERGARWCGEGCHGNQIPYLIRGPCQNLLRPT